jgi:hypothetical protein
MIKSIDIFKFVENFKLLYEGKKIQNSTTLYFRYNRMSKLIRDKVIEIYNEINCSHYSFNDFQHYVFYYYIYNRKNFWLNFNKKEISGCSELFSKDSLNKDKELLLKINKNIKFTIEDYLKIQENGECYLYTLLENKKISPSLYLRLVYKIKETENISEKQKKTNNIVKTIKEIKNGKAKNFRLECG